MPAKKAKKAPARKSKPKARKAAPSQFDALRNTVKELRTRLEKELKARKIEARVMNEAKKARDQLNSQVKALRQQGSKLATELKSALGDSKQYEKARAEAHKKIDQLKKDLSARTAELRRKSEELAKLAEQAAHRAVDIIRSDGHTVEEPPASVEAPASLSPAEPTPIDAESKINKDPTG